MSNKILGEKFAYPMDFKTIENKLANNTYECCESFYADIKWIAHNTQICKSKLKMPKVCKLQQNLNLNCSILFKTIGQRSHRSTIGIDPCRTIWCSCMSRMLFEQKGKPKGLVFNGLQGAASISVGQTNIVQTVLAGKIDENQRWWQRYDYCSLFQRTQQW